MKKLLQWWRKRRLRKAKEQYAYWKAKHEAALQIFNHACVSGHIGFTNNPYNKYQLAHLAGLEAKHLERVEELMRQ